MIRHHGSGDLSPSGGIGPLRRLARGLNAVGPDDHLAHEAVVAFADGELAMGAYLRASEHLRQCPTCAAEVESQTQARSALRDADATGEVGVPPHLLGLLSSIPEAPHPAPFPVQPTTRGRRRSRDDKQG